MKGTGMLIGKIRIRPLKETNLVWILKKSYWNGSTNDALMVFVYQGK